MNIRRSTLVRASVVVVLALCLLVFTAWLSAYAAPFAETGDDILSVTTISESTAPEDVLPPPVVFPPGEWPWFAQGEIRVRPEPPRAGEPTEICATVINSDPTQAKAAILIFEIADFGIGVPFHQLGAVEVVVPPGGDAQGCVVWMPPEPGRWCFQVRLIQELFEPQVSQRNIDVWEPLIPGEPHALSFPVGPMETEGLITFTTQVHMLGWDVALDPPQLVIGSLERRWVTLTVIPPAAPLGSGVPIVDVEGFRNGESIGGFRKLDTPPVVLHQRDDPFFAESEIHIWPYPPRAGEPTEICAELVNLSDAPQEVLARFDVADFGIGLSFEPIHEAVPAVVPANRRHVVCTTWIPPQDGHFCVQVVLEILGAVPYEVQFSQHNLDVAEPLVPGVPHEMVLPVGNFANPFTNPTPETADVWLDIDRYLPGWEVSVEPQVLQAMRPDEVRMVTLVVTPGELPGDGTPIADVRAMIDTAAGPHMFGGIRKVFRPPVPLHRFPDPVYAEREITVEPYPLTAGAPTEVCVDLYNPTELPQDGAVLFSWAQFGIGIPWMPINGLRSVHLPPYSTVRECIYWVPPTTGHVCLQVELQLEGYQTQRSRRNLDVDEPLVPGEPHALHVPVRNPFQEPVTVTLGLIPHLPGWDLELSPDVLLDLSPGATETVTLTVVPPFSEPLPDDAVPIVDVEAYVGDMLIGGFRKIYRPPVPIHRPRDPIYAESEIFIHPYPPRAFEPVEVGAEIRNPTAETRTITVTFSAADFGIGLRFDVIHEPLVVTLAPFDVVPVVINWIPHRGGLWCIQIEIALPGHSEPFISRRNIDVGEPLEPNIPHARVFEVRNPLGEPVTVTLGLIPHFPDWGLELSADVLPNLTSGEVRPVTLTVTPPADLPADGDPIVDVEAYVQGELLGGFRKLFRPPVPVHRPRDPVYAESEIGVDPYPVIPGQPVEFSVEVYNPTDVDRIVTATFEVAQFGIGLPFSSARILPNPIALYVPAQGAARGHVVWTPPAWKGKFCVQVTLAMPGYDPVWSQRNIDVGEPLEPGQPHALVFPVGVGTHTEPMTVHLGLVKHREDWEIALSQTELAGVRPGEPVTVSLTVTPALGAELGTGDPIVDVEAFVEGELIGGFRKLDRPPIPLHKPHEKGYAESEIVIDPYPLKVGEVAEISTVVQNTSDATMTVELTFGWARFGMGIPFTTTGIASPVQPVTLGAAMTSTASVTWTPTVAGHQCVLVELVDADGIYEPQLSQRNVDIQEPPPCGQTQTFTFTIYNDSAFTVTVDVGLITFDVPNDWSVTVSPSPTLQIPPFESAVVDVAVSIPCQVTTAGIARDRVAAIQADAGSVPTIDVEGYIKGALVGGIELQFARQSLPGTTIYMPLVMKQW